MRQVLLEKSLTGNRIGHLIEILKYYSLDKIVGKRRGETGGVTESE